jgi:hypothetical protein
VDYQGNSNKGKETADNKEEPKKNLEKVITGDVVSRKKGIGARFKEVFFGADLHTAAQYVVSDVLLPTLRDLVVDTVSKGVDRLVYGNNAPRRGRPGPINYSGRYRYSSNPLAQQVGRQTYLPDQRPVERWSQGRRTFENLIVASRQDADNVVEALGNIIDQYEVVSVADINELIGQESNHIDQKWGWTSLPRVGIRQVREGYEISLPPLEEIS